VSIDERPGIRKTQHFVSLHPHALRSNEWRVKWPLVIEGRKTTYNPDFICDECSVFIEVTTSRQNISDQRKKWAEAVRLGYPLKVYWWEGQELHPPDFARD